MVKIVATTVLLVGAALNSPGQQVFDVRQFGATGKRADNATKAIRDAIEACFKAGGGMVYVPPGEYTTGVLELKDNVNLHIEAGGTLLLSQNRDDFNNRRAMIYSDGAKNIAVTGRGTLDGLAKYEWVPARGLDPEIATEMEIARKAGIEMNRHYRTGMQTYMFILNNSVDVRLENITIVNSPLW
ncbi:MAG TPA: glycosyl hydrolase family 28-related protein, partial [Bryobacteraceae bacterium]|nr:glycosyl hydrolase family 28-related protein [Bryobacteraceae bacterium]